MSDAFDLSKLPTLGDLGPDRGKFLLHGDAGTGKTTLAASIAELGPILYVDLLGMAGLDSIAHAPYAKNVTVVRPRTVGMMNDILGSLVLGDHPYIGVVVEHVNTWHTMYVRYHNGLPEEGPERALRGKEKPTKRDGRQVYGEANDSLKDHITFWYGLADADSEKPIHVVMTAHSRDRESRQGAADWRLGPDVSPGAIRTVEAAPNYIGYCAIETPDDLLGDETPAPHYTVRFGPHPDIMTKTHEEIDAAKRWPAVVGQDGKRLTLPKMMKFLGLV